MTNTRGGRWAPQRIALMLARRTSIRSLGRSALIAALIAIPIAGLSAIIVVGESRQPTNAETATTLLGRSEAVLRVVSPPTPHLTQSAIVPFYFQTDGGEAADGAVRVEPSSVLPAGTSIIEVFSASATVRTATGIATLPTLEGAPWDPSLAGHFDLLSGHRPTADDEIMVSPAALGRLGVAIGGTVTILGPSTSTATVVGVLVNHTLPSSTETLFGRSGVFSGLDSSARLFDTDFYLPNHPLDWAAVRQLNLSGITALSHAVLLDPPPPGSYPSPSPSSALQQILFIGGILGAFGAFEVVLLAGAAFAVNARQQQRTLAIVASIGGSRSILFRILASTGIVLGAIGGLLGVVVGIGAAWLFMALSGDGSSTRYYGVHLNPVLLTIVIAFAVVIGWVAAIAPAISGSKLDVVGALRGARRPPNPGRRRPVIGLIVLLMGFVLTATGGIALVVLATTGRTPGTSGLAKFAVALVVIGPLACQIGLALCGPLLLRWIATLTTRAAIGVRLATRDAARNPARTVPAFAAILTTVFVAVFAMSVVASAQAVEATKYRYVTAEGQVMSRVNNYDAHGEMKPVEDVRGLATALRQSLLVRELRTLSSVPEFFSNPSGNPSRTGVDPAELHPQLQVPAENLCPSDPNSPEHSPKLNIPDTPAFRALGADPRCDATDQNANFSSDYYGHIWVGDASDLELALGQVPSARATAALASGGVVSLHSVYVHDGTLDIAWWTTKQLDDGAPFERPNDTPRVDSVPAVVETGAHPVDFGVFVSPQTAVRLGLAAEPSIVLASLSAPATSAQLDAARQATLAVTHSPPSNTTVSVETGPTDDTALIAWALLAVAAFIAIASAAVAIGLARVDGRADDATLASLGAGPRTRRDIAFWQSLLICGLGAFIGTGLGILPAFALELPGGTSPFVPPWTQIATIALALPVAIAAASWLLAGRPATLHRRAAVS